MKKKDNGLRAESLKEVKQRFPTDLRLFNGMDRNINKRKRQRKRRRKKENKKKKIKAMSYGIFI